jgi:hypothetical protein
MSEGVRLVAVLGNLGRRKRREKKKLLVTAEAR